MKTLISISLFCFILFTGCKDDDGGCLQMWKYTEWCETTSGCNIVGCETPHTATRRFNCDEVESISPGDVVLYQTEGCAKFYREYIERMD